MKEQDRFAWLWQKAVSFAARKHRGQFRKDGKTPYIAHPLRVAVVLLHLFGISDERALCAAILHDTLEDTRTDYDELAQEFGREIADLVSILSKDARVPEPQRETEYRARLLEAPWQAWAVKLADVYDNLSESDPNSPSFAKIQAQAQWIVGVTQGKEGLAKGRQQLLELLSSLAKLGNLQTPLGQDFAPSPMAMAPDKG